MKLVIVDYGMGNISSIVSALNYLGLENISISNDFDTLNNADKLILPGVGNYAMAITKIRELGLDSHLEYLINIKKKPILGICLGMQLLGLSSSESGDNDGLGLVSGTVERFYKSKLKVPHVGFNQVSVGVNSRLFLNVDLEPDFYFTHSFRMQSDFDIGQSLCHYGEDFIASFEFENIAGVQFHPELSQTNGLQLLKNFVELF